jgi:hypothetical protein
MCGRTACVRATAPKRQAPNHTLPALREVVDEVARTTDLAAAG